MNDKNKKSGAVGKIAAIYVGAVLGAGFASGQEIMIFFAKRGALGIFGAVIAGILLTVIGGAVCSGAAELEKADYKSYLRSLCSPLVSDIIFFIAQAFLGISFCIMISGSDALLHEQLRLPRFFGMGATLAVCALCFWNRLDGIAALNFILTPIMVLGMLAISVRGIAEAQPAWSAFGAVRDNFAVNALVYTSFNTLTSAAVLVPSSRLAASPKEAARGGAAGGLVLAAVLVTCTSALVAIGDAAGRTQFPLLAAARSTSLGRLYPPVIYMAMLTTAVTSGFSIADFLTSAGLDRRISAIAVCAAAIPLSLVEFSALIKSFYALFGCLGIILIFGILRKEIKKSRAARQKQI